MLVQKGFFQLMIAHDSSLTLDVPTGERCAGNCSHIARMVVPQAAITV